jgi:hypothetical protein
VAFCLYKPGYATPLGFRFHAVFLKTTFDEEGSAMSKVRMLLLAAAVMLVMPVASAQAGFRISVGIGIPVYYGPYYRYRYPVYVSPPPVYVVPSRVYVTPTPVYIQPAPTVIQGPPPVIVTTPPPTIVVPR